MAFEPAPAGIGLAGQASTNLAVAYNVQSYVIEGKKLLDTNQVATLLAKYTGTNVTLRQIIQAAREVEAAYHQQGLAAMNIVIAPHRIAGGIVPLNIFQGALAQIIVAGNRYVIASNMLDVATAPPADATAKMPATSTNAPVKKVGPHFRVDNYQVLGNTVLTPAAIAKTLSHVEGAYGTNVTLDGIRAAATALQTAYRERGYVTVAVSLPQQKLTNALVKIQVTEGRLADIRVKDNQYFSSNNVMRALPSLHTNLILNRLVFEAELNRANASRDRQIYPVIDPGPDPGTSDLTLKVKDRFPLHGKVDFNNQSSPGTPDLRVNTSAVYDNLWQREHSLGLQYSFSPELYKSVTPDFKHLNHGDWNFYDQPLVANYSGFYRMPIGNPQAIDEVIASHPGTFGYDEATHKFNLPPPSGQPEINFYASRSTIDTGVSTLSSTPLYVTNGNALVENIVQQDLTENDDLGFRLSLPIRSTSDWHSGFSAGLDYKSYQLTSYKTNIFLFAGQEIDFVANATNPVNSADFSPVPVTFKSLQYLPLSVRYDGSIRDALGLNAVGLGISANLWHSGSLTNLQNITGSRQSGGNWVVLTPSYMRTFEFFTNWITALRVDGQWSSEPLISNEQFGAGGVSSVRGYQEGQVFGDTGWHITAEQQTPSHLVGYLPGNTPLSLRGSVFTDFADTYLIDPLGRPSSTSLWGAGIGGVASIGTHWEARFLFSVPLLNTVSTSAYQPFFNFGLTAQF